MPTSTVSNKEPRVSSLVLSSIIHLENSRNPGHCATLGKDYRWDFREMFNTKVESWLISECRTEKCVTHGPGPSYLLSDGILRGPYTLIHIHMIKVTQNCHWTHLPGQWHTVRTKWVMLLQGGWSVRHWLFCIVSWWFHPIYSLFFFGNSNK